MDGENVALQRIDKMLSSQGIGSRSDIKIMVKKRLIYVNNVPIKDSGLKVDIDMDTVTVNGERVEYKEYIYIMMNKPQGVVSATADKKQKTVIDLIPPQLQRKGLFPVGRLDIDTEGLLIITNDGELAHNVLSPKKKVYKHYLATLDNYVTGDDIQAFADGIVFNDGTKCQPAQLEVIKNGENATVLVKICEGMFHQVKKMFLTRRKKVLFLKRLQIGGLKLDSNLNKGNCKEISKVDINDIFMGKID